MKPTTPFCRAMAAAKKITNAPSNDRAKRINAWAEFVKAAIRDEDKIAGKDRANEP